MTNYDNYIAMKRSAGVAPGKEFLKYEGDRLIPCSEEEFLKLGKPQKEHEGIDEIKKLLVHALRKLESLKK